MPHEIVLIADILTDKTTYCCKPIIDKKAQAC